MLLLVTIALVLVAAVTLLIGIISDNLALIFISIGASAVAAIVLAVLSQMSRKKGKSAAEAVPASASDSSGASVTPAAPEPTAATVVADEPTTTMPAVSAPAASLELPIDGYDSLRVNEILPRLDDLDLDELEAVAQYEETHKNRSTVLNRIDARMDVLEAEEAGGTVDEPADDETVDDAVAAIEEVGQPVQLADEVDEDEDEAGDDGFPIPGYDDLSESELIPLLDDLDADQLETVADREEAGQNRDGVLDAIDDRLDILEGIVPAAPAPAAKKTGVAKKTPAKKATAAPRKVAAAPAKRAPVKKAAAPAAKATKATTKVPAKAASATRKAPARATATPAPARKSAAVKKAAPVKKATAAKKATKR